jgi:hypothetical protein
VPTWRALAADDSDTPLEGVWSTRDEVMGSTSLEQSIILQHLIDLFLQILDVVVLLLGLASELSHLVVLLDADAKSDIR